MFQITQNMGICIIFIAAYILEQSAKLYCYFQYDWRILIGLTLTDKTLFEANNGVSKFLKFELD